MSFPCFLQFPPQHSKNPKVDTGAWTEKEPGKTLYFWVKEERNVLMLRETGVNLPGLFPLFSFSNLIHRRLKEVWWQQRQPQTQHWGYTGIQNSPIREPSSLVRWVMNPRKWEQIVLAFLLSVFLLLDARSNGSQRKYTAEKVIKTTAFWPEDHKEEAQAIRMYQRDDAHRGGNLQKSSR